MRPRNALIPSLRRRAFLGPAAVASVLAALNCGREPAAPIGAGSDGVVRSQPIAFITQFPAGMAAYQIAGGGGVEFAKVRIVLNNPDGSVALDTLVIFPPGATELQVTLTVSLPPAAPATGTPLALNLDYQTAAGQTVFHGGPVTVNAVPVRAGAGPPPPAQVTIPITYTGPGANAASVRISPKALTANTGEAFTFTAEALDAGGNAIPNTPIVFVSQNQLFASVNAATGAGTAGPSRGTVSIVAQLLTGPTDAATLTIMSPPVSIAGVSGSGQTGPVETTLATPLVVRVLAADGLPAAGVAVAFAPANGGSATPASASTDAAGLAQTMWQLGPTAGAQTLTASATGLSGSPVSFTAIATPVDPIRVAVATQPPTTVQAGTAFGMVVHALTSIGTVATRYEGPVTVSLPDGVGAGTVLGGSRTVSAVHGVATFTDLAINRVGTYALGVTAPSLTGATTNPVQVAHGPAAQLVFQNYPVAGAVAGVPMDPVTVHVRDALGNLATGFTGEVTLSIGGSASVAASASLRRAPGVAIVTYTPPVANAFGSAAVRAVGGIATFENIVLTAAGGFAFSASSPGLPGAVGPAVELSPGPPTALAVSTGNDQTGSAGAPLPLPVIFQVVDAYQNPVAVAGRAVTLAASHGGVASPSSGSTSAAGQFSTTWTLGGTTGDQTLTASSTGLAAGTATATAIGGGAASGGDLIVIEDWNWGTNAHGLISSGSVYPGNVQFIKNLVNFTPSGARASATKVLSLLDRPIYPSLATNFSVLASIIQGQGLVPVEVSSHSVLTPVASDVKVIFLVAPGFAFTTAEINGLKTFASQGGRIVFVGENSGTYSGYHALVENPFLIAMGASVRSQTSPSCLARGVIVTTAAHSVTTGITASGSGGFYMNCTAYLTGLGAGDVALFTSDSYTLGAVVSISYTPLPLAGMMAPAQQGSESQTPEGGVRRGRPDGAADVGPPPRGSSIDPAVRRPPRR